MPRRKKQSPNPGLTPPDLLEKIKAEVADEDVPAVQSKGNSKWTSVLFTARKEAAKRVGGEGIFSTPDVPDSRRLTSDQPETVLDDTRLDSEAALSDIVREVMQAATQEKGITFLRQMVTQVAIKASKGDQWAVEWIGNRYEGKPGQAPKRTTSIEDTENAIDQVEVAALNNLIDSSSVLHGEK